jgi:hypothetical protein
LHTHEERKALLDLMEKIVNTCPIDENNLKEVE